MIIVLKNQVLIFTIFSWMNESFNICYLWTEFQTQSTLIFLELITCPVNKYLININSLYHKFLLHHENLSSTTIFTCFHHHPSQFSNKPDPSHLRGITGPLLDPAPHPASPGDSRDPCWSKDIDAVRQSWNI